MTLLWDVMATMSSGLVFANLVDFDTVYGHRNDVAGYAGNDPTTPGSDHSREYVPLLVAGPELWPGVDHGMRRTFTDVGQTLAEAFGVNALEAAPSFLTALHPGTS